MFMRLPAGLLYLGLLEPCGCQSQTPAMCCSVGDVVGKDGRNRHAGRQHPSAAAQKTARAPIAPPAAVPGSAPALAMATPPQRPVPFENVEPQLIPAVAEPCPANGREGQLHRSHKSPTVAGVDASAQPHADLQPALPRCQAGLILAAHPRGPMPCMASMSHAGRAISTGPSSGRRAPTSPSSRQRMVAITPTRCSAPTGTAPRARA